MLLLLRQEYCSKYVHPCTYLVYTRDWVHMRYYIILPSAGYTSCQICIRILNISSSPPLPSALTSKVGVLVPSSDSPLLGYRGDARVGKYNVLHVGFKRKVYRSSYMIVLSLSAFSKL